MRLKLSFCTLVCMAVTAATSASLDAGIVAYTNQAAWQAAAGAAGVYDFNSDAAINISLAKDFGPFTVERNTAYDLDIVEGNQPGNIDGTNFLNYYTRNHSESISVTFDDPISAFAFDWVNTDTSNDRIQLVIGGSTFDVGGPGRGFFGVVEDTGASLGLPVEILFSDTPGNGGHLSRANLDNFRYSTDSVVPEPTSIALWSLGLVGMTLARRRRS